MCWPSLYRHSADRLTGDSQSELHNDQQCHNQQWSPAFPNIHHIPLTGTQTEEDELSGVPALMIFLQMRSCDLSITFSA